MTVVLISIPAVTAAATAATPDDSGIEQADLQRDLDAVHAAGAAGIQASVLTPDGEHLTAASGVADTDTHEPVPVGGHLRAGSITKPMVATVVLQLAAERTLSLDDTVEEHLPGVVAGNGNDGSQITIRQLLQHTSGLYDYAEELLPPLYDSHASYLAHRHDAYQLEELAAIAMRHPPTFAPGTSWAYSNTGYVLAAMLIEQVTGNPWSQEVHDRIIQPLELGHTSTGVDDGDGPSLPDPHAKNYQQFTPGGPLLDVTALEPSHAAASGSVISTTGDLSHFFAALLSGELLAPQQLAQMRATVPTQGEAFQGYGLGLARISLSCGDFWAHGGDGPGYQTVAAFAGDGDRGIVITVSSRHLDEEPSGRQQAALWQAIDNALCTTARDRKPQACPAVGCPRVTPRATRPDASTAGTSRAGTGARRHP